MRINVSELLSGAKNGKNRCYMLAIATKAGQNYVERVELVPLIKMRHCICLGVTILYREQRFQDNQDTNTMVFIGYLVHMNMILNLVKR